MATAYTVRFAAQTGAVVGWQQIFAPGAGFTWIVRSVSVGNPTASPARAILSIGAGGGLNTYGLFDTAALAGTSVQHVELRQQILVGEVLNFYASVANLTCLVTGYRFTET